jgi:hypothetical protein
MIRSLLSFAAFSNLSYRQGIERPCSATSSRNTIFASNLPRRSLRLAGFGVKPFDQSRL